MNFYRFLLTFQSTYSKPIPEPTFEYIVPLIALAGAAAFGAYGGSVGSGFAGQYPYGAGGVYGGPYYGSPYYGTNSYYGGDPYYGGNPYYGSYY